MSTSAQSHQRLQQRATAILFVATAAVFLWMIRGMLQPLIVAAIAAGLAAPLYTWLLRQLGGRKAPASALTVTIVLVVVVVPLVFLADIVTAQALSLVRSLEPRVETFLQQLNQKQPSLGRIPFWHAIAPYAEQITRKLGEFAQSLGAFLVGSLSAAAQGAARFFFSLFIMLYALFYFLMSGREVRDRALRFLPLRESDKQLLVDTFMTVSRATLKGTLVIGLAQGGLAGLAFAVAGIQGAVFWGVVMVVLSIIPGIGTTLVWLPATIYLFAVGRTIPAVGLLLWCALVVGSVDNILRPRLVGKDTKMPDLLVMLSTFGGLALFGAVGLVLGPVIGALLLAVAHISSDVFGTQLDESTPVGAEP